MALAVTRNGDELIAFHRGGQPARLSEHPDLPVTFACIVAVFQGKTLFVFNPRRDEWELPAGVIETGELPLEAAHRELLEESGQVCPALRFTGMALLRLAAPPVLELGAMFTGELDVLRPFPPNTETAAFMLWDLQSSVQGYVNGLAHKLAELTR